MTDKLKPWQCRRCGWEGDAPDSAVILHPALMGSGYHAPLCPCGQYFDQAAIDHAEAIKPGASDLPLHQRA